MVSDSDDRTRSPDETASVRVPCAPSATIFCSFGPIVVSFTDRDSRSTT